MLKPNCVIVTNAPEISLKSTQVRRYMEKRLRANIKDSLKENIVSFEKVYLLGARFVIETSEPEKVLEVLNKCFGIHSLALAQKEKITKLGDITKVCGQVIKGKFVKGTFKIEGKSYSKEFNSKTLEEECGGAVLETMPNLKVKLKNPDNLVYIIVQKESYFYFEKIKGARGLPIGSQGKVVIINRNKQDDLKLGWLLLKNGCMIRSISELDLKDWNNFVQVKIVSMEKAKYLYETKNVLAFFSSEPNPEKVKELNEELGVKVFTPLILNQAKTPFD